MLALTGLAQAPAADISSALADITTGTDTYLNHKRLLLTIDGVKSWVTLPKETAAGAPWNWRMKFPSTLRNADEALLERGFHIAYCGSWSFGNEAQLAAFDALYQRLTAAGLSSKPALTGSSRGGVSAYAWAKTHPDRVGIVNGDNPVCNVWSWPGGAGTGKGSGKSWSKCQKDLGIDSLDAALVDPRNPINGLDALAAAGVPLLHAVGTKDEAVPATENTDIIAERYRALGGTITILVREGAGHHPHGFDDPSEVVDIITAACAGK
ncbi:MAG: alpha/beta fold hydrolase [Planctomycetota bacterium]